MKQIIAEYKYIYDPNHENKPSGNWNRTNSGWSSHDSTEPLIKTKTNKPSNIKHDNKKENSKEQVETPDTIEEEETNINNELSNPIEENKQEEINLDDVEQPAGQEDEFSLDDAEQPADQEEEFSLDDAEQPADQEQEFSLDDAEQPANQEEEINLDDTEQPADQEDEINLDDTEQPADQEEEINLDDAEQPVDQENEFSLDDAEGNQVVIQEQTNYFTEQKKEQFLKEQSFESYIEKMNNLIKVFDQGEGKDNKVTFKAVASNLDWSKQDVAKAFAQHCDEKQIEGMSEIIAFLYYQFNNNEEKFEQILDKMD